MILYLHPHLLYRPSVQPPRAQRFRAFHGYEFEFPKDLHSDQQLWYVMTGTYSVLAWQYNL